ncbi:MAG: PAS domain S-box protein, partial [Pseudomonadota bacterium]
TGLQTTGKTYLVGLDYLMRSDSGELKEGSVLKQRVETDNAKNCFSSYEEQVIIAKDYRGALTLGSHLYIPEVKWCLLAEIDEAEALAPLERIKLLYALVGLGLLLLSYAVASWLSQKISKPIVELNRGTKIIGQGNLSYQVGTKFNDEVGELSRAFDFMTGAIRQSRKDVDRKVLEQTKEIRQQARKLGKDHQIIVRVLEEVKSERDKTTKQRDKLNAILHGIGDGVFFVGRDGKITMFNEAARNMSGFGAHEVVGKQYHEVLKFKYQEDAKVYHKFIEQTFKSHRIIEMSHHVLLEKKNGKDVPVNAIASLLRDKRDKVIGCIVVLRDMTKEEKVEKMKTEFVSLASHQLRTPLSAIKWFL